MGQLRQNRGSRFFKGQVLGPDRTSTDFKTQGPGPGISFQQSPQVTAKMNNTYCVLHSPLCPQGGGRMEKWCVYRYFSWTVATRVIERGRDCAGSLAGASEGGRKKSRSHQGRWRPWQIERLWSHQRGRDWEGDGFAKCGSQKVKSASPGNSLESHVLKPHSRPTWLRISGGGPSSRCLGALRGTAHASQTTGTGREEAERSG